MQRALFTFGRLVESMGELILPPNLAAGISNADIDELGSASRRKGYQRAIDSALTGKTTLVHGYTDIDGTDVFVVIDSTGICREE